jgi:hypothetical protein
VSGSNGFSVKGYTFAPELFNQGFAEGHGPCRCSSHCCAGGVYVDIKERDLVLSKKEKVKAQMDETQTTDDSLWFETNVEDDTDFASGKCVGTTVVNDKCVFLNARGHCAIQLAAVADGLDRWAWKPLFCILFPVEITDKVIGFDPMLQDEKPCCTIKEQFHVPLFRACKAELEHLLGTDGYAEAEAHYEGLAKVKGTTNI